MEIFISERCVPFWEPFWMPPSGVCLLCFVCELRVYARCLHRSPSRVSGAFLAPHPPAVLLALPLWCVRYAPPAGLEPLLFRLVIAIHLLDLLFCCCSVDP
eukprot:RCo007091